LSEEKNQSLNYAISMHTDTLFTTFAFTFFRGASRGSVWLSWQTPLYRRYQH